MSQALALITQNRPHQTFLVGYDMQAANIEAGKREQAAHYAPIRERLWGGREKARRLRLEAVPVDAPETVTPVVLTVTPEPVIAQPAPLNMLAPPSWRFIAAYAALKHGTTVKLLLGPGRSRPLVAARHEAMALDYQHTQASLPMVGARYNRDHTTVLYALSKQGATFKLVDVSPTLLRSARPKFTGKPRAAKNALRNAVRHAYENNVPSSVVAEEFGSSRDSVKTLAHLMGLKRADYRGKSKMAWEAVGL